MKFFHLSDLHLGLKLINHDLAEDQKYVLDEVIALAAQRKPDAVVIAGDIYDKAIPSADAVELFDYFITSLTAAVPDAEIMMISGNHDSAPRVNVFRGILQHQHIHMIGLPPAGEEDHIEKVTLTDESGPVNFYLLPFVKPSMVKAIVGQREDGINYSYDESVRRLIAREDINTKERNVMVSHQFYLPTGEAAEDVPRMDSEIRMAGNIDEIGADVLAPFDYAALGHIHKPMKAGSEVIRYCGTPLACSVSEAGQQKSIIEVTLNAKGDVKTRELPLTPLRQVRMIRGQLIDVLQESSEDYITVVLTDKADLDVIDMQERLRKAFPNLLEIRRESLRAVDYSLGGSAASADLSPYELVSSYLGDLSEEEADLLRDVIDLVQEGGAR